VKFLLQLIATKSLNDDIYRALATLVDEGIMTAVGLFPFLSFVFILMPSLSLFLFEQKLKKKEFSDVFM
jgi:hypothetical protein